MIKILKNVSGNTLDLLGAILLNNSSYGVPQLKWMRLCEDLYIKTLIQQEKIIVNDGSSDLSIANGLLWITNLSSMKAIDHSFNNSLNGFNSIDVQSAIEEAKNIAQGTVRYCATCGFDGSAGVGRYLEFCANNPSDTSPHVLAEPGILKAISVGMSAACTTTYTVYKNGSTVLNTLNVNNANYAYKAGLNHVLVAGDKISVKTTSGSSSRPVFNNFIQVT